MKQFQKAVALSILCLAASACGQERVRFKPIPIPSERTDCVAVDSTKRPPLVPVYKIDWVSVGKAATVTEATNIAKLEVQKLVAIGNQRDGIVANYILDIENKLFLCSSDAQWIRDYASKVE